MEVYNPRGSPHDALIWVWDHLGENSSAIGYHIEFGIGLKQVLKPKCCKLQFFFISGELKK